MSKFTKISLIGTGILLIAGFGFMIAGLAIAGGPLVLLSELRSGGYNFGNWHFEDGVYYKGDNEIDVTGIINETMGLLPGGKQALTERFTEEIMQLEIEADIAKIEIKTADVQEIIVNVKNSVLDCYKSELDGDTLWICYDTGAKNFSEGAEIEIEVPRHIKFDRVSVNANLGEIEIEDLQSEYSYLTSDLGNIDYSGEAFVLEAETNMGNIEVELFGEEKDYNIEAETNLGTITYNEKKLQGDFQSEYHQQHHHSAKDVKLYSNMGNIELDIDFHEGLH